VEGRLRIGVLIRPLDELEDWELRILDHVLNSPDMDLVVLISDGRSGSS